MKVDNKMNRFDDCGPSKISDFITKSKNTNTSKATNQWMNVYRQWAEIREAPVEIETLSPIDLDQLLQQFYAEVKKRNGDDYEPGSLANLQAGIERYLKEKKYNLSIIKDRQFMTSRAVLEGKRPNRSFSLTKAEEETLWDCGQLGSSTPVSLVNTIWWLFTQHFGIRGRKEHHSMKVEDFTFKKDDNSNEFLTFSEGITKTRQSGLHEKHRLVIPKMFCTKANWLAVKQKQNKAIVL